MDDVVVVAVAVVFGRRKTVVVVDSKEVPLPKLWMLTPLGHSIRITLSL